MADYKRLKNRLGLHEDILKRLSKDLLEIETLDSELRERILDYIVDGDEEQAIDALSKLAASGKKLNFKSVTGWQKVARSKFFESNRIEMAPFYYRLARFYSVMIEWGGRKNDFNGVPLGPSTWLDPFIYALAESDPWVNWHDSIVIPLHINIVEQMLALAGEQTDLIVRSAFLLGRSGTSAFGIAWPCSAFKGFKEYALKFPAVIKEVLKQQDTEKRLHALQMLDERKIPIDQFTDEVAELGVCSSKPVREKALSILRKNADIAVLSVERIAREGKTDERMHAVKILGEVAGAIARPFLEKQFETEQAPKVREALHQTLDVIAQSDQAKATPSLPPAQKVKLDGSLPESIFDSLKAMVEEYNRAALEFHEKNRTKYGWLEKPHPLNEKPLKKIWEIIQSGNEKACRKLTFGNIYYSGFDTVRKVIYKFLEQPELELVHVLRFLIMVEQIPTWTLPYIRGSYMEAPKLPPDDLLRHYRETHSFRFGLRELAAVTEALGINPDLIGSTILSEYDDWVKKGTFKWEDEAVWPYFAERMNLVTQALNSKPDSRYKSELARTERRQRNAMAVAKTFPQFPGSLIPRLWEIALDSSEKNSPAAQRVLEELPGTIEMIIAALDNSKKEIRITAAQWLCRMNSKESIQPLKETLKKEKHENVKGILIRVLEKLGVSPIEFLNRQELRNEADQGLKSGIPEALSWFPFDQIPQVRWDDTGEMVDREILIWLIVQGYKQKTAEPGPMLRLLASGLRKADREQYGQLVLESWIGQDTTAAYSPAEAEALAQKDAATKWVQYSSYFGVGYTQEGLYQEALKRFQRQFKGTAIKEKGVLAVAAACCGPNAVSAASRYLNAWHGLRLAQSKELLQMLASMDEPAAIQLLLSIANRFRSKPIREEAEKLVNLLAERKGWTRDELADRTIPSAGFDSGGEMLLDYGSRSFLVTLDKEFNLNLTNESGEKIKSLPEARKDEDAEMVKEAKQLFGNAKKQLKQILELQKERLYEAMCTQRVWQFQDWDLFLNRHPIVGRFTQRLVWSVFDFDKEGLAKSFRPLADGTLTDASDTEVTITPEAVIRPAHACAMLPEEAKAWQAHLADYEIKPLFDQFGKEPFRLPESKREEIKLTDFEGHLLEAFKLRGQALKLGYRRGEAEDGAFFCKYKKVFSSLGIEAVIEFTGNGLPEENVTVALTNLHFTRKAEEDEQDEGDEESKDNYEQMPLGEVPAVLLSEIWNDMRSIASQGTGYEHDWQKKVVF
jgi:hypothetical protein